MITYNFSAHPNATTEAINKAIVAERKMRRQQVLAEVRRRRAERYKRFMAHLKQPYSHSL